MSKTYFRTKLDSWARRSHIQYFEEHLSVDERIKIDAGALDGGPVASTFLGLTDVLETAYTGKADFGVKVNSGGTGLIFTAAELTSAATQQEVDAGTDVEHFVTAKTLKDHEQGYRLMTPDQQAAFDAANHPSATNAVATMHDIVGGGGMTDAQVKEAYERNLDTNAFDDQAKDQLAVNTTGIEDSLTLIHTNASAITLNKEDIAALTAENKLDDRFEYTHINTIFIAGKFTVYSGLPYSMTDGVLEVIQLTGAAGLKLQILTDQTTGKAYQRLQEGTGWGVWTETPQSQRVTDLPTGESLGNPTHDGEFFSSLIDGTRSWKMPAFTDLSDTPDSLAGEQGAVATVDETGQNIILAHPKKYTLEAQLTWEMDPHSQLGFGEITTNDPTNMPATTELKISHNDTLGKELDYMLGILKKGDKIAVNIPDESAEFKFELTDGATKTSDHWEIPVKADSIVGLPVQGRTTDLEVIPMYNNNVQVVTQALTGPGGKPTKSDCVTAFESIRYHDYGHDLEFYVSSGVYMWHIFYSSFGDTDSSGTAYAFFYERMEVAT